MAIVSWPPPTPPNGRANATLQLDNHPSDHNRIADALDTIIARLGSVAGAVLSHTEITANVPVTSNIGSPTTVIAAPSITFDGGPVLLEFSAPLVTAPQQLNLALNIALYEGSTDLGILAGFTNNAAVASYNGPVLARRRFTPTAGPHTYTIKAYTPSVSPSGSTIFAGPGGAGAYVPATLRIVRA